MKKNVYGKVLAAAAALAALGAPGVELSGLADIRFAEAYAFSTNRAALVQTLRPNTKPWFVYSILNAQVEGRLDEADALLAQWERAPRNAEWDNQTWNDLKNRQRLLRFDPKIWIGGVMWRYFARVETI